MHTLLEAIMLFTAMIKLLRLIRFSQLVHRLGALMKLSVAPLTSFFVVFGVMFLAFTNTAYLVFGSQLRAYSTYISSLESQIQMLLMKVD